MSAPPRAKHPEPCEKCGSAMDRVELPPAHAESDADFRWICPRCGHERLDAD